MFGSKIKEEMDGRLAALRAAGPVKQDPDMATVLMAVIESHTKQIVSLMNFLEARDQLLMKFHGIGYARLMKEAGIVRGMEVDMPPEPRVPSGASMPEYTGGLPGHMPDDEIDPNEVDEGSLKMRFPVADIPTGPKVSDY